VLAFNAPLQHAAACGRGLWHRCCTPAQRRTQTRNDSCAVVQPVRACHNTTCRCRLPAQHDALTGRRCCARECSRSCVRTRLRGSQHRCCPAVASSW
jgi:hypothetical protein